MTRVARIASLVLALAASARAHDFWIEPASFAPRAGELVRVRLRVGDHGRGENVPRGEKRIVRFELADARGARPVVGRDGQEVAGVVRVQSEGAALVGYVSNHAFVELEPAKFAAYLAEKGLDASAKLRRERGEDARPAREIYSRSAKALLAVGGESAGGFDRAMGLPLELIPRRNPGALPARADGAGFEELPLALFFEERPLAGALVAALCLDEEHEDATRTLLARTDADGRVAFELPRAGRWLVAAVHMRRAGENPERADWESFWASLTFEIPVRER